MESREGFDQDERLEAAFLQPFSANADELYEVRRKFGVGYAALSRGGNACFVIPLAGSSGMQRVLGNIRLLTFDGLRFKFRDEVFVRPAAVLECEEHDLVPTFCSFMRALAEELQDRETSARALSDAVAKWDKLLRNRRRLNLSEVRGLWGELALIDRLPDVDVALSAWLGPAKAPLDFLSGGVALECKTSVAEDRHVVSGSQVKRQLDVDAYVVSLWIQEDPAAGESLVELAQRLSRRVAQADTLRVKLLDAGFCDADASAENYDVRYRLMRDLKVYPVERVPSVASDDARVRNLRYEVDLSTTNHLSADDVEALFRRLGAP